jgi:hypothetical protein
VRPAMKLIICSAAIMFSTVVRADDATVGGGTPNSCTTATFANAMNVILSSQGPAGTLTFNCGNNPHAIVVPETFLTGQITIDGGGKITLDGNNANRIFNISQNQPEDRTEVLIKDISLIRGSAPVDFGGAIVGSNAVVVTLDNVTITDSSAAISGGAVAMGTGTFLNVSRSVFRNNSAQAGGAFAIRSRTDIDASRFTSNSGNGTGGAGFGQGGAIQSYEGILTINNSQFDNNIGQQGGAIYKQSNSITVEYTQFLDNRSGIDGGAIYLDSSVSSIVVDSGEFARNSANNNGNAQGAGGAMRTFNNTFIFATTFRNNTAAVGGALSLNGGQWFIQDSTFDFNSSTLRGGALSLAGNQEIATLGQLTFSRNSTQGEGDHIAVLTGTVELSQSTLMDSFTSPTAHIVAGTGATVRLRSTALFSDVGPACATQGNGFILSLGNNVGPTSCLGHASDVTVTSLSGFRLSELEHSGGAGQTFVPQLGSVLLDRYACTGTDARNAPRAVNQTGAATALCDVGAVERQAQEPFPIIRSGFE